MSHFSSVQLEQRVLLNQVWRVDNCQMTFGDGQFPLPKSWFLRASGFNVLKKDRSLTGNVQNDNAVDVLNKQHKRMEVTGVDLDRGEIIHSQLVHHNGVDLVNWLTDLLLVVIALFHVIEDDGFHMSQDNNQIMSQELNGLDLSFPILTQNDGLREHLPSVNVVNEDFIGELLVQNSDQVKNSAVVWQEGSGSQIIDLVVDVREVRVFLAVNILRILHSSAL